MVESKFGFTSATSSRKMTLAILVIRGTVYCGYFKCIVKKSVVMWNVPLVQGRAFSETVVSFRTSCLFTKLSYKPQNLGVCPQLDMCIQLHVLHRVIRDSPLAPEPPSALSFHPTPWFFWEEVKSELDWYLKQGMCMGRRLGEGKWTGHIIQPML